MTRATETILRAAMTADGTIPPEAINAALAVLRGGVKSDAMGKTSDEVWTAKQVAECLKKSKRMVITYGDMGLIRPIYGIGKHRIGYSKLSVLNFISAGGRVMQ